MDYQAESRYWRNKFIPVVTLIAIGGTLCFLGGLCLLLFVARQYLNSEKSEVIFLAGIGLFILTVCYIAWNLTANRSSELIKRLPELLREDDCI